MLFRYIKYELDRLHAGVWVGVVAVLASLLVPLSASAAGQITARSTTLSNSAGAATGVTYVSTFTVATSAQTLAAFKFEICDSPLPTTACANTGNSSGASYTSATTATVSGGTGTWALGTHSGNSALVTNSGSTGQTGTPTFTVTINGVTNPTAVNASYYVRVSTYTNTGATTPAYPGTDFGAMAVSTTQTINVAANVQESLTFCTGTTSSPANCAAETGSTVNVGTGADNVLSSSAGSGGISTMIAATNASSGYTLTYLAPATLTSGANTITAASSSGTTLATCVTGGASCFGINLKLNTTTSTTPAIGANVSGSGSGTVTSPYGTADSFALNPNVATQVASASAPTVQNVYTVSYVAQAGTTSKPGAYSATFNYICTGNF